MNLGILNEERYLGALAHIGEDLNGIAVRANTVFNKQHTPQGIHLPPAVCTVYHTTTQSHATTGQFQSVVFNTNVLDTHAMHDAGANTDIFVIPEAGIYMLIGRVVFAANATGVRTVVWQKNQIDTSTSALGAIGTMEADYAPTAGNPSVVSVTTVQRFAHLDRVALTAYQTSGGALTMGDGTLRINQNEAIILRIPWAV